MPLTLWMSQPLESCAKSICWTKRETPRQRAVHPVARQGRPATAAPRTVVGAHVASRCIFKLLHELRVKLRAAKDNLKASGRFLVKMGNDSLSPMEPRQADGTEHRIDVLSGCPSRSMATELMHR